MVDEVDRLTTVKISLIPQLPDLESIRDIRTKLNISQRELASLAGVSQSLIAKVERGGVDPAYNGVKRIFQAFEEVMKVKMTEGESTHMSVGDLCTTGVINVSPFNTLEEAIEKMVEGRFTQLPVIEGERVVGSITDDQIREYTITETKEGRRPYEDVMMTKVTEVMAPPFTIVKEDTPIELASLLLQREEAILVSKKGGVVGILTSADFLSLALRH